MLWSQKSCNICYGSVHSRCTPAYSLSTSFRRSAQYGPSWLLYTSFIAASASALPGIVHLWIQQTLLLCLDSACAVHSCAGQNARCTACQQRTKSRVVHVVAPCRTGAAGSEDTRNFPPEGRQVKPAHKLWSCVADVASRVVCCRQPASTGHFSAGQGGQAHVGTPAAMHEAWHRSQPCALATEQGAAQTTDHKPQETRILHHELTARGSASVIRQMDGFAQLYGAACSCLQPVLSLAANSSTCMSAMP